MLDADEGDPLQPRFIEEMGDGDLRALAHGEDDLHFLRSLGMRSAITAALRARGRLIGAVTLGTAWSGRRYRRHDAGFARVLSGRIALALDNAGLFADLERAHREREEIAATLQHGLLPPPLPEIPGWCAAAMYQPAGTENEVGGDFYDAFPITGGWMLVIGDVTGKGAAAASITAQARYTLRTAAWLSGDPLVALGTLNTALLARADSALCSAIAFTLSSNSREPVRVAVAGHLPPLLIDGSSVSEIAEAGPVLGAFQDASWDLELTAVGPGQQLVAVTDGVTEAERPARALRRGPPARRARRRRPAGRRPRPARGGAAQLHRRPARGRRRGPGDRPQLAPDARRLRRAGGARRPARRGGEVAQAGGSRSSTPVSRSTRVTAGAVLGTKPSRPAARSSPSAATRIAIPVESMKVRALKSTTRRRSASASPSSIAASRAGAPARSSSPPIRRVRTPSSLTVSRTRELALSRESSPATEGDPIADSAPRQRRGAASRAGG